VVFFWAFVAKKMCLSHGSRLILNRVDISPMVAAGLVAKEAPSLDDLEREAEQLALGRAPGGTLGMLQCMCRRPQDRLVYSARVSGPRCRL
jgi:hypothetical protein